MPKEFFSLVDSVYLYTAETTLSEITNWAWGFIANHDSTTLRFVRGDKMKNAEALFNEFSAALQFPYYFGENWGAFAECIADLDWLPGSNYILVITNSDQILNLESLDELNILLDCFEDARNEFRQKERSFSIIFQYHENESTFKGRLRSTTKRFLDIQP